ncbi:MAG: hypothetical protein IJD51_02425 [Clostridia bacterium]|nr:hypothetical protein [Clostridia bacterium]
MLLNESLMKRIKERALTEADCTELDIVLSENYSECTLEIEDLCYVAERVMLSLGSLSLLYEEIVSSLEMTELDMQVCFDEGSVDEYERALVLARFVNEHKSGIAMKLGDFYYDGPCDVLALERYREAFLEELPVHLVGYWSSVECYINLLDEDEAIRELDRLLGIDYHLTESMVDVDYVNVHLIRLGVLEFSSPRYLPLLDEAIECAEIMVDNYRGDRTKEYFGSSEEEMALCELLSRRLEYFVEKRDYVTAMATYRELTSEIGRSDAVSFYTFRDHVYKKMLEYMTPDFPELAFITSLVRGDVLSSDELEDKGALAGRVIALYRKDGEHFDFEIRNVYPERVTAYPILPIVGVGGPIFFRIEKRDGRNYLVKD